MVREIVYDAIQIKLNRFSKPAPLAGDTELLAAIIIGYEMAGMPKPEVKEGDSLSALRTQWLSDTKDNPQIKEGLTTIIDEYVIRNDQISAHVMEVY